MVQAEDRKHQWSDLTIHDLIISYFCICIIFILYSEELYQVIIQLSHHSTMSPWSFSFASRRRQMQTDCSSSVWRELMKRNSSFAKPLVGLWGTTPEQTRVQLKSLWRPTEILYQPWASEKLSNTVETCIYLAHMHYFCKAYKLGVSRMGYSILHNSGKILITITCDHSTKCLS